MGGRGPRSRYYPGANSLSIFSAQGSNPLEDCKVYGKGVEKVYDRSVKGYVYNISGGLQSKLQLPKHDKNQVFVPSAQHFSVELRVSDTNNTRRKMYFSTSFSDLKTTPLHCQIPISLIKRNKWLNLAFHVADLFNSCFRGGVNFRSIDIIVLGPVCKIRKIFTTRCRITETSADEDDEHLSDLCVPQEHLYAVGVDSCIQILDTAALQAAGVHSPRGNGEDSLESERARKGTKAENGRPVHVAFGTRMPLPLSTVQINTSLPHDSKYPIFKKDRSEKQLIVDTAPLEPKPVPNMITRCLTAANAHYETDNIRKKVDKVLAEFKVKRLTQPVNAGSILPANSDTDAKVQINAVKLSSTDTDSEAERYHEDWNSQAEVDQQLSSPPSLNSPKESLRGMDYNKSKGIRKRYSQVSLQTKNQRKESQARSKEYKASRYMDSPPESPPCGWDSIKVRKNQENTCFKAHLLENSWINQIHEPIEPGNQCNLANSLKEKIMNSMSLSHSVKQEETGAGRNISLRSDDGLYRSASLSGYKHIDQPVRDVSPELRRAAVKDSLFERRNEDSKVHRTAEVNKRGASSGTQSWSSFNSDYIDKELDPLFISGLSPEADAPTGDNCLSAKPSFDPQDEIIFEKLLSESKKFRGDTLEVSDLTNQTQLSDVRRKETSGATCLDFVHETNKFRDTLDCTFEEILTKLKGDRDVESEIGLEQIRKKLNSDALKARDPCLLTFETSDTDPPSRMLDDEGINKGGEDLDLLYDPTLDCYYDPKTNRYYELK